MLLIILLIVLCVVLIISSILVYYYMFGWTKFSMNYGDTAVCVACSPANKIRFKDVYFTVNSKKYDVTYAMNAITNGMPDKSIGIKLAAGLNYKSFVIPDTTTNTKNVTLDGYYRIM